MSDIEIKTTANILETYRKDTYGVEGPLKLADILGREVRDIERNLWVEVVIIEEVKTALGDSLAMIQELCTMLEFDFMDVYRMGTKRAIDRCMEKMEGKV